MAVGDFNSGPGGDLTAYGILTGGGLTDAWPDGDGLTCCHVNDLHNPSPTLTKRVDLVFTRGGFETLSAKVVGEEPGRPDAVRSLALRPCGCRCDAAAPVEPAAPAELPTPGRSTDNRTGMAGVPVYRGRFGPAQAERLLWRAGFGPRPGEAKALARKGLRAAVHSLTRPGKERLRGRAPIDEQGLPLAPEDAYGHDHLWWLDRMVRTSRPLVERMTLVWHDWFATSNAGVGSQKLMLDQNQLFRRARARHVREAARSTSRTTRRCCSGSTGTENTQVTRRTRTTRAS